MKKAYSVTYKVTEKTTYETKLYAETKENAKRLFEMWHPGVEVLEIQ